MGHAEWRLLDVSFIWLSLIDHPKLQKAVFSEFSCLAKLIRPKSPINKLFSSRFSLFSPCPRTSPICFWTFWCFPHPAVEHFIPARFIRVVFPLNCRLWRTRKLSWAACNTLRFYYSDHGWDLQNLCSLKACTSFLWLDLALKYSCA